MSTTINSSDHRPVQLVLDGEVEVVPTGVLVRSMMSMARHPDDSIYLNTQSGPLYRSMDDGQTWTAIPIATPDLGPQVYHGMGIARDGRLFLSHSSDRQYPDGLYGQDLYVSHSADEGATWTRSATDFSAVPPGIPNLCFHEDGNRTFVELDDGTTMFTTTIVPSAPYAEKYPASRDEAYGGQPGDLFSDVIFRSDDGGETWGDATQVNPTMNPHESNLALDPGEPRRLLLMTRCQSGMKEGREGEELMARTGNPVPMLKQGVLFESTDAGRSWSEVGFTNYYGHRGNVYFAPSKAVVVTHNGGFQDSSVVARVSLDGGRTWQDGSLDGTAILGDAEKFVLAPHPPGHSFTTPTIEVAPSHFFTVYGWYPADSEQLIVNGLFWHLEPR